MDSCEGSDHITQSEIVRAKLIAMVDGKNEPSGEGLPDGWLKECRPRRNRYGSKIKGDMYYTDPINGYEFCSLKDVHRYLESGDISQCVKLPTKRKRKALHTAGDQSGHTGKPSDHTKMDDADEAKRYDLPEGTKALGYSFINPESGENTENIPLSKPDGVNPIQRETDQVEASEGKRIQSGSMENPSGEAESFTRKGPNVKHRAKPVKGIATPLRSSPRLAALKISQEANSAPKDGPISTQTDITNQSQPKQVQKPRRKANSSVPLETKDGKPAMGSPDMFEENFPSIPNQIQRASSPYSSGDAGCQKAPAEPPVLRQQAGQGERSDGMPGSALSSLFQHVWSDPCLVFAFRTLLGDIPVLDDTLAYRSSAYDGNRNYFLPRQNLNKGAAPNWSSSAYDGNRNHSQVDHVMPMPSDKFYFWLCTSTDVEAGFNYPLSKKSDKFYESHWFPPQ